MQLVMNNGPSIARITSNAEISVAGRASAYPPLVPACDTRRPARVSVWRIFASSGGGMWYASAMSLALRDSLPTGAASAWPGCSARNFNAIRP
jgi:hypothetical protein